MTITNYYANLKNTSLINDPAQERIVTQLQQIQNDLLNELAKRRRLNFLRKRKLVKGIYLWGGVGVGKTFLLDCFYLSLPTNAKMRMHFFQFMRYIHEQLLLYKGKPDPLTVIAKQLAKQVIVLCFDEFFVKDIVDAMLLGELMQLLFKEGICIVATSNIEPDKLYERGLQRANFLKAISAIKTHLHIVHLTTSNDYRLRSLEAHGVFFTPHDEQVEIAMQHLFKILTNNIPFSNEPIAIAKRMINVKQQADKVIWFNFKDICHIPRSQHDYLFLAEHYDTIFVSEIPIISSHDKNTIRLFINLIDVLYDHRTKLVFSARESVENIYRDGDMLFEFTRTKSRLKEMQSKEYFLSNQ
jgi:cell division protein ZapE